MKINHYWCSVIAIWLFLNCVGASSGCEVFAASPFENYTFIPNGSNVYVNCSASDVDVQNLLWRINTNISESLDFTIGPSIADFLNSLGFYEVPLRDNSTAIEINIANSSDAINGTLLQCANVGVPEAPTISKTSLVVYEPQAVEVEARDITLRMTNISWSPNPFSSNNNYTVSVTSSSMKPRSYEVQTPSFKFIAPNYAPPCEVYNFSVTATPVGATYTGDGCSVPSPVLSRMLPSLPDISDLESSLNYSIVKQRSEGGVQLNIHFSQATYCDQYPVKSYATVINGSMDKPISTNITNGQGMLDSDPMEVSANLSENTALTFNIRASNEIGSVETRPIHIYTTDVQHVRAVASKDPDSNTEMNGISVHCNFITNSDAKGCVVVLIHPNDFNDITVNLTRDNGSSHACTVISAPFGGNLNNVYVLGYDIEFDGSIGLIAVPGDVMVGETGGECKVNDTKSHQSSNVLVISTVLVITILSVLIVLASFIITFLIIRNIKTKKKRQTRSSEAIETDIVSAKDKLQVEEGEHHYHVLENNGPGVGEHDTRKEHFYHVLESRCESDAVLSPVSLYHEVTNIDQQPLQPYATTGDTQRALSFSVQVGDCEDSSRSGREPPRVYHDITDLPQKTAARPILEG